SVHASRQFYHCFGCGASGDVFSFVQKIENITFTEAVRAVAQKLGVALPKVNFSSPAEAQQAKQRTALLEIHERACAFFQEQLKRPEGARAREYLAGRGLDEETIARFRIGYAPDSGFVLRDRLRAEFGDDILKESGLLSWKQEDSRQPSAVRPQQKNIPKQPDNSERPESTKATPVSAAVMYSKFRNRVIFPIANEAGRVIAFTGRTLSTDEKAGPKYLNSPETPIYSKSRVLFNFDQAKEAIRKLDYAIVVEGQMDCISVSAAGFHNVVASSGTAFTEPQARLLGRFSKNVVVNFDPDAAGAKVKAVNYRLPHIQRVPSRIARDELSQEIAQKLGIDSAVLRQELKHAVANRSSAALKAPVEVQATDAERILIRALTSATEMQSAETHWSARDGAEAQFDPARQARFVLQNERLHEGLATEPLVEALLHSGSNIADVLEIPLSDPDRRLLASILMKEEEEQTAERLDGAVRALRRIGLRRKLEQVQRELQATRGKDAAKLQALLTEKIRIKRALMDPGLVEESGPTQPHGEVS